MEASLRQNHFFEAILGSGVLIYNIDENEPVCVKFGNIIRIKVVFDPPHGSPSESLEPKHSQATFTESGLSEQTELTKKTGNSDSTHTHIDSQDEVFYPFSGCRAPAFENGLLEEMNSKGQKNTEVKVRKTSKRLKEKHLNAIGTPKRSKRLTQLKKSQNKSMARSSEAELALECDDGESQSIKEVAENTLHDDDINVTGELKTKLRKKDKVVESVSDSAPVKIKKMSSVSQKINKKQVEMGRKRLGPDDRDDELPVSREKIKKLQVDKIVRCDYCEVEFKNQLDFYNHRRAEESEHKCIMCGKVEPYEAHLIVHMQKHRRVKFESSGIGKTNTGLSSASVALTSENSAEEQDSCAKKKSKKERMKCNVCGLVVSSMDSLKIHTMLHTGECAYRCCVCGDNFSSLSSRQHHMDTHVSAKRFKCYPCGQRFISRGELAKHQLTHEIKCALCGETFPNKTSRTCHFRVSHPDDILKCPQCSIMFATQEDLKKHLVYHKKGKKEQCPVCGVVVSKLKDHMLLHSQQANEKMYVCDQCPMRYLRKNNLDRHMRTHTGEKPYACNKCTKRFRSNGMLRKHLLTHTQERPYQCEVCGKRCSVRSNLSIHMRVHSADRSYQCQLCSQAFNHKSSLRGHMKSKHSRESSSMQNIDDLAPQHSTHHLQPPAHLMSEMERVSIVEPVDRHIQLDLPVGLAPTLSSELLLKAEESNHLHQHDYSQMHLQLGYAASLPTSILIDADRMSSVKYDMQQEDSLNNDY
ncbi:unnamed protein product [Lymnaea stagnalis]|uniref:C2H2-type domain-containing protein n=1 Tax=Lymnaea stagnalis TaxID=6523 RepID=A0AAV2HQC0_LYMST